MPRKKNVLVVGAGPCGLVAVKEMKEAGHKVIAIERGKHVGGVFARDSAIAYDTLYLTTSNFLIAYSDFPPLESRPKYTSKQEYGRYLEAYAEHFELLPHIKFETSVKEAVFDREKKLWTVKVESNGMVEEHIVDSLVVASGAYQVSSQPKLEGYTGEIIHSKEYRRCTQDLTGKRALVLGTGESAVDIAGEFAEAGAETIVYSRRPFIMGPRFPFKAMFDRNYDEMKILTEQYEDNDQACTFLEALATNRIGQLAPLYLFAWLRRLMLKAGATGMFGKAFALASIWVLFGSKKYPSRADQAAVVTKNGRLYAHAAENRVHMIVSDKMAFDGRSVEFLSTRLHNAEVYNIPKTVQFDNVDVVVCCTGFMTKFDWLEHGNVKVDPRSWYKHSFVPGYDGQLMILGYARPHQGGIPPCAEMLARYGALVTSGERSLPHDYAERAKEQGMIESRYYAITSHILAQVDYPSFMNSLAQLIGCTPKAPSFLTSPTRAFQYWFYPNWPCWYRQRGPGANTVALNGFLNKVPLRNSVKLSHSGPFFIAELIVLLLSQPIYLLAFLLSPILKSHRSGMTPGWLFMKPKGKILHGDEPAKSTNKSAGHVISV